MKASIQTKLLVMCILLILLTAVSISGAYYVLTTQDKHRESRQHIQIAFKIILDDIANLKKSYATNVGEFLQQDIRLSWFANYYKEDEKKLASSTFILSSVLKAANALKDFGPIVSADRLTFYGENKRLLLVYQRHDDGDTVGGYVTSETGHDTYLPMDDFSTLTTYSDHPIPDVPLPPDLSASYQEDIPDTILTSLFSDGRRIGIKVTAPVYRFKKKAGVLVGEIWYTQSMVERYASLSETAIDFFAGTQFSIGNLAGQTAIAPETLAQLPPCEEILSNGVIDVVSVAFKNEDYYQGRCALKHDQHTVGAIHISLSQQIEKQEVKHILQAVTLISFVVILFAVGLSVLFSRKTIHSIHNIVEVIGSAAEGDLRKSAQALTQDEIGMLARKLNRMIMQLRTISGQVQQASQSVNITAETILNQMDALIQHMGQQTESVDNTKTSIEKINTFIDTVAHNTNELLAAAEQILSAIQETRASIHEVTTSTGTLTVNVQLISSSVEQVNQSVKLISENAGHLEDIARHTETEIHHMDQSFKDVSLNADRSRQLAKETMDAAISGQESVDASIQGMLELKGVVANTAQIIREVNSWGEQVSSILNIVDDITEQTSLLSLNASIISAQAGEHGRGFAVVANEIKELATRTKVSTHEIGTLIRKLQLKTEEGVNNTIEGIAKADQGMQLAHAVQDALNTILERATRSSNRASDTTEVIQQTVASSQTIRTQMSRITEMVSNIRKAIQEEEQDIEQVVSAVENISGMSEQVSHASSEQQRAAEEIEHSMGHVTKQFSDISNQTQALKQNSSQIVAAMRIIESTTEQILQDTTHLSEDTIKNLVQQSEVLRNIVHVFKIS